ncbi:MAG: hypothetical protein MJ215_05840 [Spirochaetia bacterium]|nr:hypothetical protein [Spirochaetia bacterium]
MTYNEFKEAVVNFVKTNNLYFQTLSDKEKSDYMNDAEDIIKSDYYSNLDDFKNGKYIESHIATTAFNVD